VVIDEVQWSDSESTDVLTLPIRAVQAEPVTVVACRSDQAPLHAHVAGWLAQARGAQGVEEIRLGPLSRGEVAGQVALPAGRRGSGWSTWWMPAARETRYIPSSWSPRRRPARDTLGLPAQLAELLAARVLAVRVMPGRCCLPKRSRACRRRRICCAPSAGWGPKRRVGAAGAGGRAAGGGVAGRGGARALGGGCIYRGRLQVVRTGCQLRFAATTARRSWRTARFRQRTGSRAAVTDRDLEMN